MEFLPTNFAVKFPLLQKLNIDNNRIIDVYNAVNVLAGCSQLHTLNINLTTEEEVDYVLK